MTSVERWGVFEAAYEHAPRGNAFTDITFGARFSHGRRTIDVDGFYDGDGVFRVRFMPDREGRWTFVTRSNQRALAGQSGTFDATAPTHGNRGPVRVSDTHHFSYADGTPYSCVGTTAYVWNLQPDARAKQTLRTLARGPGRAFNKMRMCVFPKHYRWNEREPAEYPFPVRARPSDDDMATDRALAAWRWDFSRFDPAYFQRLDRHVAALGALGVEADVILFHPYDRWGFSRMPRDVDDRYARYVVARLGAYRHVWWAIANEWDLFTHKSSADFNRLGRRVAAWDPYQRLRSIHHCLKTYDHKRAWITHASLQLFDAPLYQDLTLLRDQYKKPIVIDENRYEGNVPTDWGSLPARQLVHRFWMAAVAGAYNGHSETYEPGRDGVLWWSHGAVLKGASVARLGFLRAMVESGPARGITPVSRPLCPWTGGKGDDWRLFYFGEQQPRHWTFDLPEGAFTLELVDPWAMTTRRLRGTFRSGQEIELPGRPYLAVRATRAVASARRPAARPSHTGKKKPIERQSS